MAGLRLRLGLTLCVDGKRHVMENLFTDGMMILEETFSFFERKLSVNCLFARI